MRPLTRVTSRDLLLAARTWREIKNSCCQMLAPSDISKITRLTQQERSTEGGPQPHRKHLMKQRHRRKKA